MMKKLDEEQVEAVVAAIEVFVMMTHSHRIACGSAEHKAGYALYNRTIQDAAALFDQLGIAADGVDWIRGKSIQNANWKMGLNPNADI